MIGSRVRNFLPAVVLFALITGPALRAQTPPDPQPDSQTPNLFYGAVPPGGETAPVLVFVHGLATNAYYWWTNGNDMYSMAYAAGYRTAFMSLSADNSPNSSSFPANGAVLRQLFPLIAAHYNVPRFYIVAHSEGGLDTEYALLYPSIAPLVKAVFGLAAPNHGTELADWAFGPGRPEAGLLGLLTPALYSMRVPALTAFRTQADPILSGSGVVFYTLAGDVHKNSFVLRITGRILSNLTEGEPNDGLVPVSNTLLPYATDLGVVHCNHFQIGTGTASFAIINAQLQALELGQ